MLGLSEACVALTWGVLAASGRFRTTISIFVSDDKKKQCTLRACSLHANLVAHAMLHDHVCAILSRDVSWPTTPCTTVGFA